MADRISLFQGCLLESVRKEGEGAELSAKALLLAEDFRRRKLFISFIFRNRKAIPEIKHNAIRAHVDYDTQANDLLPNSGHISTFR